MSICSILPKGNKSAFVKSVHIVVVGDAKQRKEEKLKTQA
jgi:hypothetical protein